MIIAVENGLGNISDQLKEKGYTMVGYPGYKGAVDAFIYKEDMISGISHYQNNIMAGVVSSNKDNGFQGVLVINANNKSVNQIEQILRDRVYSPLFNLQY